MQDIVRKARRLAKAAIGKDLFPRIQIRCRTERFGSDYGGWNVAVQSLTDRSVVYSFGVGEDISFDLDLISRYNVTVHAFDPTPKSIVWVKKQKLPEKFILHNYGLASIDGTVEFAPPTNPNHVSHRMIGITSEHTERVQFPVKRLETIMSELDHSKIDLLKMDIEGTEYQVINDIERSGIRPTQLLIEFHHRFPKVGVQTTKAAIHTLNRMGYSLFSVSTSGEEYGFLYTPVHEHSDDVH